MRLFLQINVGSWQEETFEKPLLSYASSQADDILGTDLDNQSDPYVVGLVRQLLDQASGTFVFIKVANENQPLDGLLALINQFFALESRLHQVVVSGSHLALSRMLTPLGERAVFESDEATIKALIKTFAQTSAS